jgi:hypothetical protein
VRNGDVSLTGYFDYRPKDANEGIVAAKSTDNGVSWTYQGEALEQNPGYCPNADVNDDGQGHPHVLTVGGTSRLYTLQRPAGDAQGIGMLVHTLNPTPSNALNGVPSAEKVGIDPDAFATGGASVPNTGGVTIGVSQTGSSTSPEQLLAGKFVDLTATPTPTASSIITCTGVTASSLTSCTTPAAGGITVSTNDLIEQVIGTVGTAATIPAGPNTTTGDGGIGTVNVTFATQVTAAIFNANAPNRAYVDGVAVYCNQSNANPTNKIQNCTTGVGHAALSAAVGDPVTSDPIIPATATMTNGLVAPDGMVGTLPSYPGAPAGSTIVMYTEKILNYYVAGVTTNSSTVKFGTASSIAFTPSTSIAMDMPAAISPSSPVTIYLGDVTASTIVPVTCTGLTTGATDTLTGCTNSAPVNDTYNATSLVGAPGATIVPNATLALTGQGAAVPASAKNIAKLFKNNEDLTVLRVAYTTDGVNFSSAGLDNNGVISGASNGASNYGDISNPSTTTSPSNLNDYATPGTALATEMRFVGSAGSIVTNPDGSYGLFLSGAWAADGDSDAFNQIFYATSTDGEHWSIPTSLVSTDYTFAASVAQDNALAHGTDSPLDISAYYSGRAYGPSVVPGPHNTLTMVFAGYRLPKPITTAGTVLGTNSGAQYTVGATDPALYRNILVETLQPSTGSSVATTTAIGVSNAAPVVGQTITYTATVAPVAPGTGTPTGTVTFSGGAGVLCSTALNEATSDQATCSTTYQGVGSDSVTASYGGDANYATSTSSAQGVTIAQDQTTTDVSSAPAHPVVGESVTLTSRVAVQSPGAGTPTGTVAFSGDGGPLCTGTLNALSPDVASCTTTYTATGTDHVSAAYGGDTNDASSSSASTTTVTTGAASTTSTLSTSDATPVVGESVTFTATVAAVAPGAGAPTGTVTFTGNSGVLCVASLDAANPDEATCPTSYGAVGTDSVTASYAGDGNYTSSSTDPVSETIGAASTSTAVSASPTNPVVGQPVTYTATVSVDTPGSGTPTGTVTFTGSAGTLCTKTLNGSDPDQASCTTTYTSHQSDSVAAQYAGDGNYDGSTSAAAGVSVTPASTTTDISVDHASPVVGQTVTFTATVADVPPGSGTPTGMVTFTGAAGTLCTVALNESSPDQATCSTSYPATGSDSVTESYAGDDNSLSSDSSAQDVTVKAADTTTSVGVDNASPVVGQPITFTATVGAQTPGAGLPTGTVTFTGSAGDLCTQSLDSSGQATCTVSYAGAGSDSVTATYNGDANFNGSTSSGQHVSIGKASTTLSLGADATNVIVGQTVTFTATVDVTSPGAGTPTGQVTFSGAGGALCSAPLNDMTPDRASCSTTYTSNTTDTITATYAGSTDYSGSTSNSVTEHVGAATTTTTLRASASPAVTGQAITFTATVAANSPSHGTPTGTLLFNITDRNGHRVNCATPGNTVMLSGGVATCKVAPAKIQPALAPLHVFAGYLGSSSYGASAASFDLSVNLGSTAVTVKSTVLNSTRATTLTAKAAPVAPATGRVSGTITFSFSSSSVNCTGGNTVSAPSGTAKCVLAAGVAAHGLHVTASYGGSATFKPSSGSLTL